MRRTAVIAASVATALAAGGVIASTGGAQTTGGTTINLVTKNCKVHYTDNPPKAKKRVEYPGVGDALTIACTSFDQSGAKAGTLDAYCHITRGGKAFVGVCEGLYRLAGGEIYVSARTGAGNTTAGPVTGGTDMYAGARGTFVSVDRSGADNSPSDDVITLLP
jgi:hypothetical protein